MAIPNMAAEVKKLYDTGLFNLKTEDGEGAFVDATVAMLNGIDPHFKHLKKKAGQTDVHGHGEDSVLYLLPNNKAQACDFVIGAGGSNPQPGWNPDPEPFYTHADAHDPDDHGLDGGGSAPAPTYPSYEELGGDEGGKTITRILEADYQRAKGPLDGECGTWPQRTNYDFLTRKVATVEASIAKHQPEWRQALNAERAANGLPPITW